MTNIFLWIYNLIPSLNILSISILVIATIAIIFLRWRSGVILVFIWLYLEDVIRRLLPGQPPQVMLIKDGLLLLTYFAFFATLVIKQSNKNPLNLWRPPFLTGLLIFAGWCIVEAFNPILPGPLFVAIGLRSYLWYVPVLFLGYYMFQKQENLIRFCRILVYTSIPLALIAIVQYIFYDLTFLLIQPLKGAYQFHSFIYEDIKQIPAIFGTGERFGGFIFLLFLLGVGLWFYPGNSSRQKLFIIISVICSGIGVFISGRRAPMYLLVFGALSYMLFYHRGRLQLKSLRLWKSLLKPLAILLMVVFIVIYFGFKDISRYFVYSIGELLFDRPSVLTHGMLYTVENSGFLGSGTGAGSQGLEYIPGGREWLSGGFKDRGEFAEGGIAKIWYELGPIGALIFIFFYAQMLLSWLREVYKLKESILYSLGFSFCLYLILMLLWFVKGHQVFGDATALVPFWFFMGVLFRLKDLNKANVSEQN